MARNPSVAAVQGCGSFASHVRQAGVNRVKLAPPHSDPDRKPAEPLTTRVGQRRRTLDPPRAESGGALDRWVDKGLRQ